MNAELIATQTECRRRQKELSYSIEERARAKEAIDNRGWCNLHIPELALHYKSKVDEYWRVYRLWFGAMPENPTEREIDDQIREARLYKMGRAAFLLIETVAGAVLAAIYFNAPRVLAVIIGVILAFLLGAAAAAVVTRWVRHTTAIQPTKQLERITRGLLVLGVPWLLACVSALAVLRSQGTGLGAILFFISTTLVTLLSPVCSGLCAYAAELLLWSKRLCADLRWIRALARELDLLLVTSERHIPPGGPGPGSPPNAAPVSRVLRAIAPTTTTVALVVALFGASVLHAGDLPVYVFPDLSPSARSGEVIRNLKNLSTRLARYDGPDTLLVSVTPFFEDAYGASSVVTVNIPGVRPMVCPAPEWGSEIARLSKSYAENARREAERLCDARREQARREVTAQRSAEIAKLNAAIDHLSTLHLPGRCTAVNAIIRRAVRETPNGISIVISDVENTCPSRGLPVNLQPDNRVFIIPVSSQQHSIEEGFDAIQERLTRSIPWIEVVESFRLEAIMNAIVHPENRIAARR
jgi:hypothetical protein